MKSTSIKPPIVISGFDDERISEVRCFSSYHGDQRNNRMKPTRSFRNWLKYFKNPYFCFIGVAVFCLYLIFALFHENSSITFSVDLENAIHSFLTEQLSESGDIEKIKMLHNPKLFKSRNNFNYRSKVNKNNAKTRPDQKVNLNQNGKRLQMIDPHQGIPFGEGQIYLLDDFLFTLDVTTLALFRFTTEFPMNHQVLDSGYAKLKIKLLNGSAVEKKLERDKIDIPETQKKQSNLLNEENNPRQHSSFTKKAYIDNKIKIKTKTDFQNSNHIHNAYNTQKDENEENGHKPSYYVLPYIMTFQKVSVTMMYHIQVASNIYDSRINLDIVSDFEKDLRTDTIVFDIYHTRFQEKSFYTILYTINLSLPIVIAVLNFLAIFRLVKESFFDLYSYSKRKSKEVGRDSNFIFTKRFDNWNIFAICTHFMSIVAMILYIFIGQAIEQKVPPINVFLSIATFMHCILLIRYLNLKPKTFLIMTVLYKSSLILVKFLLGCLPFFFAFWAFGVCFFGHLSFVFASPLEAASYLFCVMHGDSILALYDNTIIQNDYSVYLGFFYSSFWLAFSLLLMFNITISIFQDVLRRENEKIAKKDVVEENHFQTPLHLDFLANNIPLMMNNNQYQNPNVFQNEHPF